MCVIGYWLGGDEIGRSSTARGRVSGERPPSLQAQGAAGRHHQGGQASLLLSETGREEARKGSLSAKAFSKKKPERVGLSCDPRPLLRSSGLPFRSWTIVLLL